MESRIFAKTTMSQNGAILLVSLVFLLLLSLLAVTVLQGGRLELLMAGNEQFREEMFQRVEAVTSVIAFDADNFAVTGNVGDVSCDSPSKSTGSIPDCGFGDLASLPAAWTNKATESYQVVRQGPLVLDTIPFRLPESQAGSAVSYDAAIFEVDTELDGTDNRLGKASVASGVVVRIIASGQ